MPELKKPLLQVHLRITVLKIKMFVLGRLQKDDDSFPKGFGVDDFDIIFEGEVLADTLELLPVAQRCGFSGIVSSTGDAIGADSRALTINMHYLARAKR